jgi:hypothetical protein
MKSNTVSVLDTPDVNFEIMNDLLSSKFSAWSKHCSQFYNDLLDLIVDTKMLLAKNILKASALITDLQMLSTRVPYEGKLVDMTEELYLWVSMSPSGYELKDFFTPPDN